MTGPPLAPSTRRLSKSRFVTGWKCPCYLWWKVHEPDAPELQLNAEQRDRIEQGNVVGARATELFPGGVLIDFPYEQMQEKLDATRQALADGAPAIFEAAFYEDGVFVAVDILERIDQGFRLIEVKATNSVKDEHIPDAAVQVHVLRKAGLDVGTAALLHLNPEHRHPDEGDLFVIEDITAHVEVLLPGIPELIQEQLELLASPSPALGPKAQCGEKHNKECPFDSRCWPQDEDHVRNLYYVGTKKALGLMEEGVHHFVDVPPDVKLREPARRQLRAWELGAMTVEPGLHADLEPFRGRAGFLDFESITRALPPWDGMAPWGMAPVQFSYHERREDGDYTHVEWLPEGGADPRPALARALIEATANVTRVAMYSSYERRCVRELQKAVPELATELAALDAKLVDLQPVIRDNVAHSDFMGSFSIKKVLKPLVPELGYEDLDVGGGMQASVELARLLLDEDSILPAERAAKRAALLEYCKLDTWAMVGLVERLEELAGGMA